jgi:photosystem II stability/assembly factor-like uncharacterized protein
MRVSRLVVMGMAAASLLCAASGSFGSTVGRQVQDVLDEPAIRASRPSGSALLGVAVAGKRLVAVGEHGRIVLSDDNGATWRQAKSVPVRVLLTAVRFATPQKGWAVGHSGVVLRSEDGGETWVKQLDGKKAAQLVIDSVNKGGKPSSDMQLLSAQRLVEDGPDKPFLNIYVESEEKAYILGAYNLLFRTEDGGKSWQPWQSHVDNPMEFHLYAMRRSGRDLFLAGEQGLLLRSSDGGNKFTPLSSPYEGSYFGLIEAKGGELVLFGLQGNAYWSGDGGRSWRKIEVGHTRAFSSGTVLEDGRLLLVSVGGDVMMSLDQGRTFQSYGERMKAPISDVVQTSGGGIVTVGMRGVVQISGGSGSAKTVESGVVK